MRNWFFRRFADRANAAVSQMVDIVDGADVSLRSFSR